MKTFKTMLERKEVLKEFDRYVFESIVEKVIVGETDENGDVDPYKLTFVYKTGFKDDLDGDKFKSPRKNASSKNKIIGRNSAELSSYTSNHINKSSSYSSDDTCGDSSLTTTRNYIEIFRFILFHKNFVFIEDEHNFKKSNKNILTF